MNYQLFGKTTGTHGLRGELKILTDITNYLLILNNTKYLYIDPNYQKLEVLSHRVHKNFILILFKNYEDINLVENFRNKNIYFNREDIKLDNDKYLDNDLIGFSCYYKNKNFATILEIINNNGYKLFSLSNNKFLPYHNNFIEEININDKKIIFKGVDKLL